jgi:hypothetical protein
VDSGLPGNDGKEEELDYTRLLSRALRAIHGANVRSGILPPQSGLRQNDEPKKVCGERNTIPTQPSP